MLAEEFTASRDPLGLGPCRWCSRLDYLTANRIFRTVAPHTPTMRTYLLMIQLLQRKG